MSRFIAIAMLVLVAGAHAELSESDEQKVTAVLDAITAGYSETLDETLSAHSHGRGLATTCFATTADLAKEFTDLMVSVKAKEGCDVEPPGLEQFSMAGVGAKTLNDLIPKFTAELSGIKLGSDAVGKITKSKLKDLLLGTPGLGINFEEVFFKIINAQTDDSVASITTDAIAKGGDSKAAAETVKKEAEEAKKLSSTSISTNPGFLEYASKMTLLNEVLQGIMSYTSNKVSYSSVTKTFDGIGRLGGAGGVMVQQQVKMANAMTAFTKAEGANLKEQHSKVCAYIGKCFDAEYFQKIGSIISQATTPACLYPALENLVLSIPTSLPQDVAGMVGALLQKPKLTMMIDKMKNNQHVLENVMSLVNANLYLATEQDIIGNICGAAVSKPYDGAQAAFVADYKVLNSGKSPPVTPAIKKSVNSGAATAPTVAAALGIAALVAALN